MYRKKTFSSLISMLTLSDLGDFFYEAWADWHTLERCPRPMLEKNCNTSSWTGRLVHVLNFHTYIDEITKTLKPAKEELLANIVFPPDTACGEGLTPEWAS